MERLVAPPDMEVLRHNPAKSHRRSDVGVLNRSYWKGADKRSYRAGGEFQQNIAILVLQKEQAVKTADSVQAIQNRKQPHILTAVEVQQMLLAAFISKKSSTDYFRISKMPLNKY